MTSRRDFLKTASLVGSAAVFYVHKVFGKSLAVEYFGLNDFIESHPEAVFILKTSVDEKTNTLALKDVGNKLAQTLFVSKPNITNAFPVATTNIAIKPNITSWGWDKAPNESTMGIQTDPYFVEGMINALQDLTVKSENIYLRDGNYGYYAADKQWYNDLSTRTGTNIKDLHAGVGTISEADIQWIDVPNGVWYSKIAYLWPINSPGSCLINIAKFKSHTMGMTLCSKNLQGTNAMPYVSHCNALSTKYVKNSDGVELDVVANARNTVKSNYQNHVTAGIPRWAQGGLTNETPTGGLYYETHSSRCLDNNSILHPLINIIEGVYGREGPFVSGPDTDGEETGYGRDILTNIVIFGKNARHVDIIGTFLAGHEPGNFGLFHIAKERGLSDYLNPRDIPLYEWKIDGGTLATPATLESFTRTNIRTKYLQDVAAGEPTYHMQDQPYDYSGAIVVEGAKQSVPQVFAVQQNFPNPFNPTTSIQYYIPKSGNVRLEIFDIRGQVVDVLVDGYMPAGDHLKVWNSAQRASGTYFYRILYGGFSKTKSMILIK